MRASSRAALFLAAVLAAASASAADTPEGRLREALHRATEQLRDAQDQIARLQAKEAEDQRQIQTLSAQTAELKTQASSGQKEGEQARRAADQAERELKLRVGEAQGIVDKWQSAYNQAAAVAKSRDEAAARFQALNAQLTERTALCEMKNGHLYDLGNEILDRFSNKGFLEGFSRMEPFTQLKRVQLETIVQDYQDKIHAQKLAAPPQPQNLTN
jgi:chromosome segregation ATPase